VSQPPIEGRSVDDIAVAHTPPGGWSSWPPPVLAGCLTPLAAGAPDLRGLWRVAQVEVGGEPVEDHRALGMVQRIEQAGDRLVVTAAGIIHDMRCDGSEARGVQDVAEMDKATPIRVVASYEDGVHVLRPVGLAVEVRRWRAGATLVWAYLGFTCRCERIGAAEEEPTPGGRRSPHRDVDPT
jgi:hypothetical protein